MGPRLFPLASLALLLLALCSTASATVQSYTGVKGSSTDTVIKKNVVLAGKDAKAGKLPELEATPDLDNTIFGVVLKAGDVYDKLPQHVQTAVSHGVLCDKINADTVNKKLINLVYEKDVAQIPDQPNGNSPWDDVKTFAKTLKPEAISIDCDTTPNPPEEPGHKCLCTDKKALLICIVEKLFPGAKPDAATCRAEALKKLKEAGLKKFGDLFEQPITTEAQLETEDETILCDATTPAVEEAAKKVYAADALFWLRDEILITILGLEEVDLDKVCALPEIKEYHPIAACMCTHELGFSFCYLKELSKFHQEEGFITCSGAAPAKDETKKPSKEKKDAKIKPKAKKGSEGGGSGDGSSTTKPSPAASAATSILPLAPAATAAALLLLRH